MGAVGALVPEPWKLYFWIPAGGGVVTGAAAAAAAEGMDRRLNRLPGLTL